MSSYEIRRLYDAAVVKELLGENWRPDRPLEIAGKIGHLLQGTPQDYADYKRLVGEINGIKRADNLLQDAIRDYNEPPQGRAA